MMGRYLLQQLPLGKGIEQETFQDISEHAFFITVNQSDGPILFSNTEDDKYADDRYANHDQYYGNFYTINKNANVVSTTSQSDNQSDTQETNVDTTANEPLDDFELISIAGANPPDGNTMIYGTGSHRIILGTSNDDTFIGVEQRDRFTGAAGDDWIESGGGDDQISGGSGNDTIYAGDGNDRLYGGSGHDKLFGDAGDDKITGRQGDDIIHGGEGNDYLQGHEDNDSIYGDAGNDTLKGDDGNDYLDGGDGDDYIEAGIGNDTAFDGGGNDRIILHAGDDTLRYDVEGNQGNNDFYGGDGGFDTLVLEVSNSIAQTSWFIDMVESVNQKLAGYSNESSAGNSGRIDFHNYDPSHQYLQFNAYNFEALQVNIIADISDPRTIPLSVRYGGLMNGEGQTVAIIDTGFDYHLNALGGGFGEGYRAVGGYDTIYGDGDPYSNGHWHGTHVASIIGSSGAKAMGWAPAVDFVLIRSFTDSGYGSPIEGFNWLRDNFDTFENPITTLNMSFVGSSHYYVFEFLNSQGVFLSAGAGNSFSGSVGVYYPAASEFTVPVGAHDSNGTLWYKSNRVEEMVTARGHNVNAYVPDSNPEGHTANHSGTSMATPQVSGASVLLRELMETVSMEDVNQDMIYDVMYNNAQLVYDSKTGIYYHNLDMKQAVEAVTPEDDFANTANDATYIGVVGDGYMVDGYVEAYFDYAGMSVNNRITGINGYDTDYFTFTSNATGTLDLNARAVGFTEITPEWQTDISDAYSNTGSDLHFSVQAGQDYTVGLTSTHAMGHYQVDFNFDLTRSSQTASVSGEETTLSMNDVFSSAAVDEVTQESTVTTSSATIASDSQFELDQAAIATTTIIS